MNKGDLIDAVARDAGISKTLAGKVLDSVIGAVIKSLKKGDKVALAGLGTFSVAKRKARIGRNSQTGREIRIPAKKVAKFKVGTKLVKAAK